MRIVHAGFQCVLSDSSSGKFLKHLEFDYDPNNDTIVDIKIDGEFVEHQEIVADLIWKLYGRNNLYEMACEILADHPSLPKVIERNVS